MTSSPPTSSRAELERCPFVRLVNAGRIAAALRLAAAGPEPAERVVRRWLVAEARRQLAAADLEPDAGAGLRQLAAELERRAADLEPHA